MAITTFAELKSAVKDWVRDTDVTDATVESFIAMLEGKLNRQLRSSHMETTVTVTGVSPGTTEYTLPTDYLALRSVTSEGSPMTAKPAQIIREGLSGTGPLYYAVEGRKLLFSPAVPDAVDVEVTYFRAVPALSDVNTSNWLLENYPDVYLTGSLAHMELYKSNDERIPLLKAALDEAIAELNEAGLQERLGQENGGVTRRSVTVGPTPHSLRIPEQ